MGAEGARLKGIVQIYEKEALLQRQRLNFHSLPLHRRPGELIALLKKGQYAAGEGFNRRMFIQDAASLLPPG